MGPKRANKKTKRCSCGNELPKAGCLFDCLKPRGKSCSKCRTRVCHDCYNPQEKLCNTCLEKKRAPATGRSASGKTPTDDAREPQNSSSGTLRGRTKAPEDTKIDNLPEVQVHDEKNQDDGGNGNQEEVPERAERPKASEQKDPSTEITPRPSAGQLIAPDDQREQMEHTKTFIHQEEPAEEDPGTGESLINRQLPVQKQERSSNEEPGRSSAQHRASGQNSYPQNSAPTVVSKTDHFQETSATKQLHIQPMVSPTLEHTGQRSVTSSHQEQPAEVDPGTREDHPNWASPVQKQEKSSNEGPGKSSGQHRTSAQNSYLQDSALAVVSKANNALPETNKTPPEVSKVDNVQDTRAAEQKFQYQSTINSTSGHTPQSSVMPFQQEKPNEVKPEIKDGTHQPVLPVPKSSAVSKKEWFLGGTTSSKVTKPDHGLPKNMADILSPEVTKLDNQTQISKVHVPPAVAQMDNFQKNLDTKQGIQHLPKEILPPGHHTQLVPSEGLLDLKELEPGSKGHSNLDLPVQKSEKKVHESLEKSAGLSRTSVPNSGSRDKGSPEVKKVQGTLPEDSRMDSVQGNTGVKVSIPYQSIAIRVSRHSQEMQGGQQKPPQDMTIKEIKAFLESRGKKVAKGDEKWALVEMVQKIQEQETRGRSAPEQRPTSGKLSDAGHNPVSTVQTEYHGKTENPEHQTTRPPMTKPETKAVPKVQTQEETKGQHQEDQGHKKEVASKMSVVNSDPVSSTEPKDLMDTPSVQDSKDSKMDQNSEAQQTIRPPESQPQTQAVTKVQTHDETKGQLHEEHTHKQELATKMSVVSSDPVSSTEPKDLMDTPSVPEPKDRKMDQSSEELTVVDIREMTVRQLKDFLQKRGIRVIGGVEKSDLVQQVTEIVRKGDNQGTGSKQLVQDAPSEVPALKEETQFRTQCGNFEEQSDIARTSDEDDTILSDSTEAEQEPSESVKQRLSEEEKPDQVDQDLNHVPHQHSHHKQNEGYVLADLFEKYEIKSNSDIINATRLHLQEILASQGIQVSDPIKREILIRGVKDLWEKTQVLKRANEQRRSLDGDQPFVDTSTKHSSENEEMDGESKDATKSPQQMSGERPETEGQTGENNEEVGRQHENIEAANQGHTEPRDVSKIGSLSDIRSELEIDQLGVRQLKTLLQNHAVRQDGIQEKSEMVAKVKQLWHDIMKRIRRDVPPEDLCRICMSEFVDCLLLECGHSVTCITCGRKIQECPMCRQYISSKVHLFQLETEQGSDPVCLICKRNPRNSALLPCGHVATCYECGYAITHCPHCQEYIRKPVRMYKS